MTTTKRPSDPKLANLISERAERLLSDDRDKLVVDLKDPDVKTIVKCRALAYAARYLRSILADQAADLLDDRIAELSGVDPEATQIDLRTAIARLPCPGTNPPAPEPARKRAPRKTLAGGLGRKRYPLPDADPSEWSEWED
jgi:hypothetical protein